MSYIEKTKNTRPFLSNPSNEPKTTFNKFKNRIASSFETHAGSLSSLIGRRNKGSDSPIPTFQEVVQTEIPINYDQPATSFQNNTGLASQQSYTTQYEPHLQQHTMNNRVHNTYQHNLYTPHSSNAGGRQQNDAYVLPPPIWPPTGPYSKNYKPAANTESVLQLSDTTQHGSHLQQHTINNLVHNTHQHDLYTQQSSNAGRGQQNDSQSYVSEPPAHQITQSATYVQSTQSKSSKQGTGYKKLESSIYTSYKKLENSVYIGYKRLENSVYTSYKRLKSSIYSGYERLKVKIYGYKELKSRAPSNEFEID